MAPTGFGLRPSSGSLKLSLAKVILILRHSVSLYRNLLSGGVAASSLMMVVDRNMKEPSNFNVNCNQSFNKCASVGE